MALDRVDVWFQDEARFGQQNTTSKIWAKKGTRPRVVKQQQFLSTHIFGAVCPATGQTEAIIAPYLSKDIMKQHLQLISDATPCGRHAVVIVDRASWHMGNVGEGIKNVSVIPLPPYSPELNPVEQIWAWMRDRELSNRTFSDYDDIVEQVSRAWNVFRSNITNVKHMCFRAWTNLIT